MARLNPHPGVYGSGEYGFVSVLDPPSRKETVHPVPKFVRSLVALAAEIDWAVLWVIEATSIVAMLVLGVLMVEIRDLRSLVALAMALAYFTMAAVTGGYLLLIKNNS